MLCIIRELGDGNILKRGIIRDDDQLDIPSDSVQPPWGHHRHQEWSHGPSKEKKCWVGHMSKSMTYVEERLEIFNCLTS